MISTKCIEKFPDEKCPCFLIYKAGKPISNTVCLDKVLKGDVTKLKDFFISQGIQL